jgi:hypothetical protein
MKLRGSEVWQPWGQTVSWSLFFIEHIMQKCHRVSILLHVVCHASAFWSCSGVSIVLCTLNADHMQLLWELTCPEKWKCTCLKLSGVSVCVLVLPHTNAYLLWQFVNGLLLGFASCCQRYPVLSHLLTLMANQILACQQLQLPYV